MELWVGSDVVGAPLLRPDTALAHAASLATFDQALAAAARRHGVEVLPAGGA